MITYEMIAEAQKTLVENWEENGKKIIALCATIEPFNRPFEDFLKVCTPCGGNWGGMLLTGIQEKYPEVWEAIPDDMGCFAWSCLCSVLILFGVDTNK